MKLVLFGFVSVILITEGYGFLGRLGGGGYDGKGYYPFEATQFPIYFPKCKEFMKAIDRKLTENGSGPFNCMEANDRDDCNFQQLMRARMDVTSGPCQKCIDQVQQFLNGVLDRTETTSNRIASDQGKSTLDVNIHDSTEDSISKE
ncbi:uncharacterized protein NPIL_384361 [Nephila pilipes]|uniref:Spider venom protein n=1 Tax=Nephila pilipes TaxID=299642 RepID=A0A8X6QSZ6_NEPPI|nr:uncharacterized protein NPIL_384361 [Nephila pilipes]